MSVLTDATKTVTATEDTRFAMIGGAHLGQRFLDWNFASSRKDRIEQAKTDWCEGRFPEVPGDNEERIPLPGE
jgi:redox-sensitive bicupin YhaK (pirin superfamily)